MDLLLVIDLQNAFINDNTNHLIKKINNLIHNSRYDNIVFTRFINNNDSIWTKKIEL